MGRRISEDQKRKYVEQIETKIANGASTIDAIKSIGVPPSRYYDWRKKFSIEPKVIEYASEPETKQRRKYAAIKPQTSGRVAILFCQPQDVAEIMRGMS